MRASILRDCWANHSTAFLRLAVALMAVLALLKLGDEFRRLVWEQGKSGAIDLKLRHDEVQRWFSGEPVYSDLRRATYPPATYAMLWPLLGWLSVRGARCLWAITTLLALGWLSYLVLTESRANNRLEQVFVVLVLLSMNATGVAIGNGQFITHVLPPLVAGLVMAQRKECSWRPYTLPAALMLVALVKPTISVPFFWIMLFVPGTFRPALLVLAGYVALTLFAASFQEPNLLVLMHDWVVRSSLKAYGGDSNLYNFLAALGLKQWVFPTSLLLLMSLGIWTYRHRHEDIWVLLGVTAIVARLWSYHRLYDDVLILLPDIALFRLAKQGPSTNSADIVAGVLLALSVFVMLAPARLLLFWPPVWNMLFTVMHVTVWIIVLVFLVDRARIEKNSKEKMSLAMQSAA